MGQKTFQMLLLLLLFIVAMPAGGQTAKKLVSTGNLGTQYLFPEMMTTSLFSDISSSIEIAPCIK